MDSPPVNALGASMRAGLLGAAAEANSPDIEVVVLFGNRRCFSAGGDIDELAAIGDENAAIRLHEEYLRLYRSWYEIPVPVLAGISGYCLGGGLELALSCDLRYATQDAYFAASGVNMGLVESAHSLPAVVSAGTAAEMLFTASRVSSVEAHTSGLVTGIAADLERDVLAIAETITKHPTAAVRATKLVMRRSQARRRADAEESSVRMWRELQRGTDHAERVHAFLSRRKA